MTDSEIKYSTFVVEGGMGLYINGGAPEVCARLEFAFAPTYPECVFRTLHLELQFNWTQESALRLRPPPSNSSDVCAAGNQLPSDGSRTRFHLHPLSHSNNSSTLTNASSPRLTPPPMQLSRFPLACSLSALKYRILDNTRVFVSPVSYL